MERYVNYDRLLKLLNGWRDIKTDGRTAIFIAESAYKEKPMNIVRCKDCKYRSDLLGKSPFTFYSCTHNRGLCSNIEPDSFCSYGEKREDR